MAGPAVVHPGQHRRLDLAFGDVAGPDRIPFGGMVGEIAFGRRRAVCADRREPARIVRDDQSLARRKGPVVGARDDVADRAALGAAQENPATPPPPSTTPGFAPHAAMARTRRRPLLTKTE